MAEIRIAANYWTCDQRLSKVVLIESVPPVSKCSTSGIVCKKSEILVLCTSKSTEIKPLNFGKVFHS
ncbi:hypothetical protein AYI69_g7875 [Smittium culicis]|uniref:Uncharacterized protein n=1 Tax=Smittium culicis TaxID=133412 RepID=A0A1R1XNV2_9FUNG|nr:hypothetical protein AYI69_g7875 [Smittium culicis]